MPTPPGLSQSFLDICKSSLLEIRAISSGENPTGDEANDALIIGNQMIDTWQGDATMVFTSDILDFHFQPGKQAYTMGAGGDFDTPRPNYIEKASAVLDGSQIELPIQYTLDEAEWQSILKKDIQTTYPWICYDAGDFPLRTLRFWPIPAANSVRLYPWAVLNQFADLNTPYRFPAGYAEAIRYNLALRLAGPWSANVSPMTIVFAAQALAKIQAMNISNSVPKLACDDHIPYATNVGYTGSDIPPIY